MSFPGSRFAPYSIVLLACLIAAGCAASANNNGFFGKTDPPRENILRYVSGSEPESLDPQISDGQPEARIYMALYEGLLEYDPKTTAPIPALAETWEVNKDSSEFTFHLRHDGRFSNGDPISARDFVYTIRRGLSPKLASRNAALAYYIKNAESYNNSDVFVLDPGSGQFLLAEDFAEAPAGNQPSPPRAISSTTIKSAADEYPNSEMAAPDTAFHHLMHSPERLTLPGDDKKRAKALDANPKLKSAIAGKEFV